MTWLWKREKKSDYDLDMNDYSQLLDMNDYSFIYHINRDKKVGIKKISMKDLYRDLKNIDPFEFFNSLL